MGDVLNLIEGEKMPYITLLDCVGCNRDHFDAFWKNKKLAIFSSEHYTLCFSRYKNGCILFYRKVFVR